MRFVAPAFALLLVIGWGAPTDAALPPSELMEARLKQARESRKPLEAAVVLTVTDETIREFRTTEKLVTNGSLTLTGDSGSVVASGEKSGQIGRMVHWLVLSSDPIAGLTARGDFRPGSTSVEVNGEIFGYRYGADAAIVVTRSLDQIIELRWSQGGVKWAARFEHRNADWPSVVSVTRGGLPHLRIEIGESGESGEDGATP